MIKKFVNLYSHLQLSSLSLTTPFECVVLKCSYTHIVPSVKFVIYSYSYSPSYYEKADSAMDSYFFKKAILLIPSLSLQEPVLTSHTG